MNKLIRIACLAEPTYNGIRTHLFCYVELHGVLSTVRLSPRRYAYIKRIIETRQRHLKERAMFARIAHHVHSEPEYA